MATYFNQRNSSPLRRLYLVSAIPRATLKPCYPNVKSSNMRLAHSTRSKDSATVFVTSASQAKLDRKKILLALQQIKKNIDAASDKMYTGWETEAQGQPEL